MRLAGFPRDSRRLLSVLGRRKIGTFLKTNVAAEMTNEAWQPHVRETPVTVPRGPPIDWSLFSLLITYIFDSTTVSNWLINRLKSCASPIGNRSFSRVYLRSRIPLSFTRRSLNMEFQLLSFQSFTRNYRKIYHKCHVHVTLYLRGYLLGFLRGRGRWERKRRYISPRNVAQRKLRNEKETRV